MLILEIYIPVKLMELLMMMWWWSNDDANDHDDQAYVYLVCCFVIVSCVGSVVLGEKADFIFIWFVLILESGDMSYRWIFWWWYQLGDVELSIPKMCKFVGVSLLLGQVLFFLVEKLIYCTSNDEAMYDNL